MLAQWFAYLIIVCIAQPMVIPVTVVLLIILTFLRCNHAT